MERLQKEWLQKEPDGTLIYDGAIDDHPTTEQADIPVSKSYITETLSEAMSGEPGNTPATPALRLLGQVRRLTLSTSSAVMASRSPWATARAPVLATTLRS